MPTYTQANQPIEVITPLGTDVLLITGFSGQEGISRLFHFQIDMIADAKKEIAFDKMLGQKITIRLNMPNGKPRYFNGICSCLSQGGEDANFINYHMEIVPQFWLLTKRAQSRIFQQLSVPDILKKVLLGVDVDYQIQGTFQPRNYCVQYRETDFNFASRLMEDEGIYYFFTHANGSHKMVVANTPSSHPAMPLASALTFEKMLAETLHDDRIVSWQKQQELVTGQFTLRDHKFEMHGSNLEAKNAVLDPIQVGKVAHKVKAGNADSREVYDYPGEYAQRFDGINSGGGAQAAEINKILQDNVRVAGIRSQQEAVQAVSIHGASTCRNLVSGHKFTLQKHGAGDGDYVLTGVQHQTANPMDYRNAQAPPFQYTNSFTAIPFAMPFRPQRLTPKPFVQGTQTAVVVGQAGEEIFCDKYGRVKVQFHWDRQGQFNASSSCWIRVSTIWAGKTWGIINVPRIGHEVIVGFEEGDPDLPIIIGSVYNADHMPPGTLPNDKMVSGLKSNTTPGGGGYNGMIFNDTKGKEKITVHAQYDMDTTVEHDDTVTIKSGNHKFTVETGTATYEVKGDHTVTIKSGNHKFTVETGTATYEVKGDETVTVKSGNHKFTVETGTATYEVKGAVTETFHATQATTVEDSIDIKTNKSFIHVTSPKEIKLTVGGSTLTLTPDTINLTSPNIVLEGKTKVAVSGAAIASNASGQHEITGAPVKIN